jgi:1-acyl-sn-glycerol-3-phosphate acyltransferase
VTVVAAIFLFVAMFVVHPLLLLFDRYQRVHHYIAKIWATLTIFMFYKLVVKGMENLPLDSSPGVYVANHRSFLDIYTLLIGRCFKFMFSIIGWATYLLGVIPLRHDY